MRIIFVAHGSPDKTNHDDFLQLFEKVRNKSKNSEYCFLEYGAPSIDQKFETISSSEHVFIQPLFLFKAGHMKEDIPTKIQELERKNVNFILGNVISEIDGFDSFCASCVIKYLGEVGMIDELDDSLFLFVGRGTSDPETCADFYRFSRLVWEKMGKPGYIEIAFAEVTKPLVSDALHTTKVFERVIVVPIILFRGYVLKRIEKELEILRNNYLIIPPLGYIYPDDLADFIVESIPSEFRSFSV